MRFFEAEDITPELFERRLVNRNAGDRLVLTVYDASHVDSQAAGSVFNNPHKRPHEVEKFNARTMSPANRLPHRSQFVMQQDARVFVNPYESPTSETPPSTADWFVNVRAAVAVVVSCFVVAALILLQGVLSFSVSCTIVVVAAVALGLMPRGYGNYDWALGLWIIFLGPAFGIIIWCGHFNTIDPLDRIETLREHVAFLGFLPGIAAAVPYAVARAFTMRVFERQPYRAIFSPRKLSATG